MSCERPPTVTVSDEGGRESVMPVMLTCGAALDALAPALADPPAPVLSLDFGYGRYCPPGVRCGPFSALGLDQGFVVVTFDGAPTQVAAISLSSSGQVIVTGIEHVPGSKP